MKINFNLDSATEFLNSIENKCQFLVEFPNMGRSYAELLPELRGIFINPYVILFYFIFYRLIKKEIIRVVNGYLESLFS